MFSEPIKTLAGAKEYFRAIDGSRFHMWREFPERYEEYKQLSIPKKAEIEWHEELFAEHATRLQQSAAGISLWELHSRLYDIFENLQTVAALLKMLEVTEAIRERIPPRDRVLVAETINGEQHVPPAGD